MKRLLFITILLFSLSLLTSCYYDEEDLTHAYDDGMESGYSEGYKEGYNDGQADGYDEGYAQGIADKTAKVDEIIDGFNLNNTVTGKAITSLDDFIAWYNDITAAPDDSSSDSRIDGDYGNNDSDRNAGTRSIYTTVYVSRNGVIHSDPHCSGMKYYTEMSYSDAVSYSYRLCSKCY